MTTIKEIAQLAGVSKTTVSRVLNGRAQLDPVTESRVQGAMVAAGYVPRARARALAHGRGQRIGFLVPSLELPRLLALSRGVFAVAAASGHAVKFHAAGMPGLCARSWRE